MLSPSDFNSAVPQFTNGNYASNPVNPQYIAEPSSTDYNRGTEPLQTLPAQWWNWFLNKFTSRFNKLNVYVKNIFNELSQLLSLAEMTPDGTEGTPTVEQLKTMFACCYPSYVKETEGLVPNTTTVNGHALTGNVSVTRSDLGLGTSSTVNTGTGTGCIPLIGYPMGTTNNNIVVTDSTGKLKPSGTVLGTASGCDASCFRASTWTPSTVTNACKVYTTGTAVNSNVDLLFANTNTPCDYKDVCTSSNHPLTFNPSTGTLYSDIFLSDCFKGCLYGSSTSVETHAVSSSTCSATLFISSCKNAQGVERCWVSYIRGDNGFYYGNICGNVCGTASNAVSATKASQDSSGCAFGTAARYACGCFLSATGCATDSAKLAGCAPSALCVACSGCATSAVYLCSNSVKLCISYGVGNYLNFTGYCGASVLTTSVAHATHANDATCASRVDVLANAWCISCVSATCYKIVNCCNFPIFAFGQGWSNSIAMFLGANATCCMTIQGGLGGIESYCGFRVY